MKLTSRHRLSVLAATGALTAAGLVIPVGSAAAATGPDVAMVRSYVAGGITSSVAGQPLTFVFRARNNGPGPADLAITLVWAHGIDLSRSTSRISCGLPNGSLIEPDGNICEPGPIRPGQRASSLILNGVATGTDIDVKACASNLTVSIDPVPRNNCRTLRVDLPDPYVDVRYGLVVPPDKTHVNLFVDVACRAPSDGTAYLSSVVWQGVPTDPSFVQGQGQTQVVCDGVRRQYSFEAVREDAFPTQRFTAGPATAESSVTYCQQVDPDNLACYALGNLVRQETRFKRLR